MTVHPRPFAIRTGLLLGLLLSSTSVAWARGTPGSALESVLELAVFASLVAGLSLSDALGRVGWSRLAGCAVLACILALLWPGLGWLLGVLAFGAICPAIAAAYVVRDSGLLSSAATATSADDLEAAPTPVPGWSLMRWVATTYLFWTVVALTSFELLPFLAIPLLLIIQPEAISRFLPFILPPLAVALATGTGITAWVSLQYPARRRWLPLLCNLCVLLIFIGSAEMAQNHGITLGLQGHQPQHLESRSFLRSVLEYQLRAPHASFQENGHTYHWSYAQRQFIRLDQPPIESQGRAMR